jgi:hypothetical protein
VNNETTYAIATGFNSPGYAATNGPYRAESVRSGLDGGV